MKGIASEVRFLLKVARPGFWLTSVWFYLLPLGQRDVLDHASFWAGLIYVTFPTGMFIYGWNDVVDFETDRLNPRKDTFLFGARPTAEQIAGLPWRIVWTQAPFLIGFTWLLGCRGIVWFAALATTTALYNAPQINCKGRPGFDLLNQAAYLLVFVLSSWLSGLPQAPWFTFLFGALFAMHSHLFGEIMDLEPDRAANRRTTAVTIGRVPAKILMAAMLAAEALLLWKAASDAWSGLVLFGGAFFFAADALFLWRNRPYTSGQMRLFFLGWNAAALISVPWIWQTAKLAP